MASATVNMHEAKTRLSELVRAVEAGDEILLARNGVPVARISAYVAPPARAPGRWRGRVVVHHDLVSSDPDVMAMFDESTGAPLSSIDARR